MAAATTDADEIAKAFELEPHLRWYLRCRGVDGFVCAKFGSADDRAKCEVEFGKLRATRVVVRDGGTEYWVFRRLKNHDPLFRLNRPLIPGVKARLTSVCPLSGNRHRSNEMFRWRDPEITFSHLSESWIASLPRRIADSPLATAMRAEESPLAVVAREEFDRRAVSRWESWGAYD